MATNYPAGLDEYADPAAGQRQNNPSHSGLHKNHNDAIEAIERELGTDPSGSEPTVKDRLAGIEAGTGLQNAAVTTNKLAQSAVTANELADNAVDTNAIQSKAVTAAKIADDTITAAQIAANAVGASELADNAVDTNAIADSAVTSAKIADGTITATDVAAGTFAAFSTVGNLLTANQASGTDTLGDTTGFTAGSQTTIASSGDWAAQGSRCFAQTCTHTAAGGGSHVQVAVTAGETYTVTATIKALSGSRAIGIAPIFYHDATYLGYAENGSAIKVPDGYLGSDFTFQITVPLTKGGQAPNLMLLYFEPQSGTIGDRFGIDKIGVWKGMGGRWEMPGVPILGLQDPTIGNLLTPNQASGGDHGSDTAGIEGGGYTTVALYDAWFAQGRLSTIATWNNAGGGSGPNFGYRPGYNLVGKTLTATVTAKAITGTRQAYLTVVALREDGNYTGPISSSPSPTTITAADGVTLQHTFTVPATVGGYPVAGILVYVDATAGSVGDQIAIDKLGLWEGAGGQWAMPGTPITGLSEVATNGAVHLSGTGAPEGVVTAAPGSTFLQTDSTTDVKGWIRWVKATGTGSTGWVAGAEADTGWRQLGGALLNSWAAGYEGLLVRRIGAVIYLSAGVAGASASDDVIYDLPSGFVAALRSATIAHEGYGTTFAPVESRTNGEVRCTGRMTDVRFTQSFATADAWPSSLPGSAA